MTAKYTYKGTDIQKLIVTGSTTLTNYTGFTYGTNSVYNISDKPLPFSISQNGVDISTKMDAAYVDLPTTGTSYTVPVDYNSIRAILEGGGGGGGGNGGCGYGYGPGQASMNRHPGGSGAVAANGKYVYMSAINIDGSPRIITYAVGTGGGAGQNGPPGGGSPLNDSPGTNGNDGGPGVESKIGFNLSGSSYLISAAAGGGGQGGYAGSTKSNGASNTAIIAVTNTTSTVPPGIQLVNDIAPNINPASFLVNYSLGGINGETATSTGKPGYIRLYLLRD